MSTMADLYLFFIVLEKYDVSGLGKKDQTAYVCS